MPKSIPSNTPPAVDAPMFDATTGAAKPQRFRTPEEQREYTRQKVAAHRAKQKLAGKRAKRVAEVLDDPAADPRQMVRFETRFPLALRQRLDNAAYAMSQRSQSDAWSQRAIVERFIEDGLDQLEAEQNSGQIFPKPPEGFGARERSQRRAKAHEAKARE